MTGTGRPNNTSAANFDALRERLAAALHDLINTRVDMGSIALVDAIDDLSSPAVFAAAAKKLNELEKDIVDLVTSDPRFPGCTVFQILRDGGAHGFYPAFVATPLLRVAALKGSAEAAVEWLQKVLSTTGASGKIIHAIWGAPVEAEIALAGEVSIVPISALPDSANKRWLLKHPVDSAVTSMLDFVPPQSALVIPYRVQPFLYAPESGAQLPADNYLPTNELLCDVQLALTVVGPRVTTLAAQWFSFDDPDLNMTALADGRRAHLIEILPSSPPEYTTLDPEEASEIVQRYLNLPEGVRRKVRVALNRLQHAQKRRSIGDRAVELSTAFETLLGDGQSNEMTHKMKVRSVRILGGSPEVRRANAAIMTWMYNARSKLVHTGEDITQGKTIDGQVLTASQLIESATAICVGIIKRIVRDGGVPDWTVFDIL